MPENMGFVGELQLYWNERIEANDLKVESFIFLNAYIIQHDICRKIEEKNVQTG